MTRKICGHQLLHRLLALGGSWATGREQGSSLTWGNQFSETSRARRDNEFQSSWQSLSGEDREGCAPSATGIYTQGAGCSETDPRASGLGDGGGLHRHSSGTTAGPGGSRPPPPPHRSKGGSRHREDGSVLPGSPPRRPQPHAQHPWWKRRSRRERKDAGHRARDYLPLPGSPAWRREEGAPTLTSPPRTKQPLGCSPRGGELRRGVGS